MTIKITDKENEKMWYEKRKGFDMNFYFNFFSFSFWRGFEFNFFQINSRSLLSFGLTDLYIYFTVFYINIYFKYSEDAAR